MLKLSNRLQKIADLLLPAEVTADIGTDHAYLPVWLCQAGKTVRAVASDIRPGPAERARSTVRQWRLEDRIEVRVGPGLETVVPGEADAVVVAGMGGLMIAEILRQGRAAADAAGQLLLQPMSSVPDLREFLNQNNYQILEEALAAEEKKLYHILRVAPVEAVPRQSPTELFFGKELLASGDAELGLYLSRQRKRLAAMLAGLDRSAAPEAAEKKQECAMLIDALNHYEEGRGCR